MSGAVVDIADLQARSRQARRIARQIGVPEHMVTSPEAVLRIGQALGKVLDEGKLPVTAARPAPLAETPTLVQWMPAPWWTWLRRTFGHG